MIVNYIVFNGLREVKQDPVIARTNMIESDIFEVFKTYSNSRDHGVEYYIDYMRNCAYAWFDTADGLSVLLLTPGSSYDPYNKISGALARYRMGKLSKFIGKI